VAMCQQICIACIVKAIARCQGKNRRWWKLATVSRCSQRSFILKQLFILKFFIEQKYSLCMVKNNSEVNVAT
jgi:hypothetical protein